MRINHNIAALNTYRQLSSNNVNTSKSIEKLSSGLRINRAGDDAAGLAISEKMRSQIRGLDQAARNSQDAISLIQTAEGALSETHSILQRMRELAVQASNETNTDTDRDGIQKEINQLTSEINRIGNTTEFNTKKLLDGSFQYTAATAGKATAGAALAASTTIFSTATSGNATAGAAAGANVDIHGASSTAGSLTGNVDITNGFNMTATNNELTVTVGSVTKTIAMAVHDYTDATGAGFVQYKADLQAALDGAFGAGVVTVGDDGTIAGAIDAAAGTAVSGKSLTGDGGHVIAAGNNELTLKIDGSQYTVSVAAASDFTDATIGGGAGSGNAAFAAAMQAAIRTATSGTETVTYDEASGHFTFTSSTTGTASGIEILGGGIADTYLANVAGNYSSIVETAGAAAQSGGNITLTAATAGENVSIGGGNMMGAVFSAAADGSDITVDNSVATAANNVLTFNLDGAVKSIILSSATYADADALAAEINTKLTAGSINATAAVSGGKLIITSDATGASSTVDTVAGSAAAALGFNGSTVETDGKNANNQMKFNIDGEGLVTVTIQDGDYSDKSVLAAALQSAINNATSTAADVEVTVNADGKLVINSGSTGSNSTVAASNVANNDGLDTLGLATVNTKDGTDKAATELTFQIGANKDQSLGVSISDMKAEALGVTGSGSGFSSVDNVTDGTNSTANEKALDVTTTANAMNAISVIDNAITAVSTERSKLGAVQNRLEHTINNLGTSSENLTAAESRIRDVDMAKEMMEFTKNNILTQAAQAMLAQANQQPQSVLQLLR